MCQRVGYLRLPGVSKTAGFDKVDFDLISAHSDILKDHAFLQSKGLGIPLQLVKKGFLSSKLPARITVAWRDMLKNKNHIILRQLDMTVGKKKPLKGVTMNEDRYSS